jgi:hypothetical protein
MTIGDLPAYPKEHWLTIRMCWTRSWRSEAKPLLRALDAVDLGEHDRLKPQLVIVFLDSGPGLAQGATLCFFRENQFRLCR